MKKFYTIFSFFLAVTIVLISCSEDTEDANYVPIPESTKTDLTLDLNKVPFQKLSEYKFFKGNLKNQEPVIDLLPYEPASALFSDYAHKKRFVWMPKNTTATFDGNENVFNFPKGAVLIKTFYYDNVQPNNNTKIIETRLLIKQETTWKAYDYIWNEEQTEAVLDGGNGVFVPITWLENGASKSVNYKTPATTECNTCHKIKSNGIEKIIPIGPKPQNLNNNFNYKGTFQNQLTKWKSMGFLGNDIPTTIKSAVNWKDVSKNLEERAKSYIDINCAHCHRDGGHCAEMPHRFNFNNNDLKSFGVCLPSITNITNVANIPASFVINGGNADISNIVVRMGSTAADVRMPILGRKLVDEEGLALIKQWISSLPPNCR